MSGIGPFGSAGSGDDAGMGAFDAFWTGEARAIAIGAISRHVIHFGEYFAAWDHCRYKIYLVLDNVSVFYELIRFPAVID